MPHVAAQQLRHQYEKERADQRLISILADTSDDELAT
jgi:hypothetical protein